MAQEDRKEARLFFTGALSVCLMARLKQSNSSCERKRGEEVLSSEGNMAATEKQFL